MQTSVDNFPLSLAPQATTFITQSVPIYDTTVNTATWTAESPTDYLLNTGICTVPDISGTGKPLNLEDNGVANLTLPFDFPFYDITTNQITVSNDGVALLGPSGVTPSSTNEEFPTASLPYGIAPFWDDLDNETGNVYAGLYTYTLETKESTSFLMSPGENPLGTLVYYVIQWEQRSHAPGPGADTATFVMALLKSGQGLDGYIVFCYEDTMFGDPTFDNGASATIGINMNELTANQFSYNTAHPELNGTFGMGFIPLDNEETFFESGTATVIVDTYVIYLPVVIKGSEAE